MKKNQINWWIDWILFSVFWISFFPAVTGLEVHQWLGTAAAALAIGHLILHWNWVESVTLRFFSRTTFQARVYYVIDLGMLAGFVMILLTGLLISTWLNLPLYDPATWMHVHLMASVLTLLLAVTKIILHWRWVADAVRRFVLDPAFARAGSRVVRAARPVDRRDFLKIAGVLGAATVITLHELFDDAQRAQAQSILPDPPAADVPPRAAAPSPQPPDAGLEPFPSTPAATQAVPAIACVVLCPNGCAYPGRCRKYVDRNGNNYCDNGECL